MEFIYPDSVFRNALTDGLGESENKWRIKIFREKLNGNQAALASDGDQYLSLLYVETNEEMRITAKEALNVITSKTSYSVITHNDIRRKLPSYWCAKKENALVINYMFELAQHDIGF
mgnify:CR=1 FL=1